MARHIQIARWLWLPVFLLAGVSWLFAPGYYHAHYDTIQLISSYEGGNLGFSWVFRTADVIAAVLLVMAVWLFGIWRRDRIVGWFLLAIGLLSVIDVIFTDRCSIGAAGCQGLDLVSSYIHVTESVVVAALVVALTYYHAQRYRRVLSWAFLALQGVFALLVVTGLLSRQEVVVVQYTYELLMISWLAWLVDGFTYSLTKPVVQRFIRRLFAIWALMNGALAIVIALTHHALWQPLFYISPLHGSALAGQHEVIAGVFMLYLARHINLGQRRAAILLMALFGSEVIKYSLITPSLFLLAFNLTPFILLLYGHRAFNRNVLPLPFEHRVKDIAVVMSGVLVAVVASLLLSSLFGKPQVVERDIRASYQKPVQLARHDEDRIEAREGKRLRVVAGTLVLATLTATAWGLFRPARFKPTDQSTDRVAAEELLARYSTSSEDYFKLWPYDKNYYFSKHRDGFVAYSVVGTAAFALADPIAPDHSRRALLEEFVSMCRSHGWAVCFLLVRQESRELYANELKLLKIGSSAVIDVEAFDETTSKDKWWRWQRNRAVKAGFVYELATPPHSPKLIAELSTLSDGWLAQAHHSEYGFALGYFDPTYMQQCRLHLVRNSSGQVVAFANEVPLYNGVTQHTVDLIRYLPGENGAMPFLLMQCIGQLYRENTCKTFDLGFVPLAGMDSSVVTIARRLSAGRFSSLGLQQFKNKFDPTWQSNFIAYDGDLIDLARIANSLEDVLKKPAEDL